MIITFTAKKKDFWRKNTMGENIHSFWKGLDKYVLGSLYATNWVNREERHSLFYFVDSAKYWRKGGMVGKEDIEIHFSSDNKGDIHPTHSIDRDVSPSPSTQEGSRK
ncbi:hypothetical protein SUGI_0026610 [Cryptomeria japonica]|nr:hypothetical protein SUGI_0026610 [Cryptomeria japonica]